MLSNIIFTGSPGCGKSSIITDLIERNKNNRLTIIKLDHYKKLTEVCHGQWVDMTGMTPQDFYPYDPKHPRKGWGLKSNFGLLEEMAEAVQNDAAEIKRSYKPTLGDVVICWEFAPLSCKELFENIDKRDPELLGQSTFIHVFSDKETSDDRVASRAESSAPDSHGIPKTILKDIYTNEVTMTNLSYMYNEHGQLYGLTEQQVKLMWNGGSLEGFLKEGREFIENNVLLRHEGKPLAMLR